MYLYYCIFSLYDSMIFVRRFRPLRFTASVRPLSSSLNRTSNKKLVIFDQHGTLVSFHSVWLPWANDVADRLETLSGRRIADKVFQSIGLSDEGDRVNLGVLASGTMLQVRQRLLDVLNKENLPEGHGERIVGQTFLEPSVKHIRPLDDLPALMSLLRKHGVLVAVCTSSNRAFTNAVLQQIQVDHLVNETICGDDPDGQEKPSPHNVRLLCDRLAVDPSDVTVVGDTPTDMEMGRLAGVGMTVGVLSGVGTRGELGVNADRLVNLVGDIIPLVLPHAAYQHLFYHYDPIANILVTPRDLPVAPAAGADENPLAGRKKDLVIFDKDGTLICFHTTWSPWARQTGDRLAEAMGDHGLRAKIHDLIGFNEITGRVVPGLLAEQTAAQIRRELVDFIKREGVDHVAASKIVAEIWHDCDTERTSPLTDLRLLFTALKNYGVKIAICTSDSRGGTVPFLERLGLTGMVDMIVCGDDPHTMPKPSPHNALMICKKLGIEPSRTVMVGDTKVDMEMGRAAGLGATVGVLSGVGSTDDLRSATHIFPSVGHLLPFVLPSDHLVQLARAR